MRVQFYRRGFDTLVLELIADEASSHIPAEFFENYYGVEMALTMRHVDSNRTFNIGIYETDLNKFEGVYSMDALPFGLYRLEGRVHDHLGNYAVLTDYHALTTEPVQTIEVLLEMGYGIVPIISTHGRYDQVLDSSANYGIIINVVGRKDDVTATGRYVQMIAAKGHYDGTLGDSHV